MQNTSIPVHIPARSERNVIWIEHILPTTSEVYNSVHRHSYHELFLFLKGSGSHMVDLEVIPLDTPSIHLVGPGQVHKLDRSADCKGVVVMFQEDRPFEAFDAQQIRSLLRPAAAVAQIKLEDTSAQEAFGLIHLLEKELEVPTSQHSLISQHLLAVLLLKCFHWSKLDGETTRSNAHTDMVTRFLEQVELEYLHKKQVSSYAKDLAISPGYLNELVKKRLGRSASAVLHERLLLEAKRLLLHSNASVKEVSFALQMEDPAYFTRMFRKATGMTPGEYREHIREKYQH